MGSWEKLSSKDKKPDVKFTFIFMLDIAWIAVEMHLL